MCTVWAPVAGFWFTKAGWQEPHPVGVAAGELAWQRIPNWGLAVEQEGAFPLPPTPFRAAPWQGAHWVESVAAGTVAWLVRFGLLGLAPAAARAGSQGVGWAVNGA